MGLFRNRKPADVFTPGGLPLGGANIYVSRDSSESKLERGIERNECPVVFGDYGVGKTTLVRRFFSEDAKRRGPLSAWLSRKPRAGRVVYFASADGLTMPKVFERVLEHLRYRVTTEITSGTTRGGSAGFSDTVLSAELHGARHFQTTSKLAVSAPTDEGVLAILDQSRLVVIIDELHRASDQFREELVPFIKATRVSAPNSKLVLIGTTADALQLVSSDPGIDRFVSETPVATMSTGEARLLIANGFERLGIRVDDDLVSRTIVAGAGAPSTLQSLCLDMAERAVGSRRRHLEMADLTHAVKLFIQSKNGRMSRKYIEAIETQGEKRYRKRILHAIANLEGDYATMDDIREYVSGQLGIDVQPGALSGPLRDLKGERYGRILQDIDRESGGRVQTVTSFTDPTMKSYVRFLATVTQTAIVHEDEIREGFAD